MKLAFDHKKLHLRFIFGTGLALSIAGKLLKKECPEADFKPLIKEIKNRLKNYKRANGALTLVEIVSQSDNTRITIKL